MVLLASNGAVALALRYWRKNPACTCRDSSELINRRRHDYCKISGYELAPIDSSLFSAWLALLLFVIMLPVLVLIYVMVWATGESPIYSQIRVGRGEEQFKIYKFRTIPETNRNQIVSRSGRMRAHWFRVLGGFLRRTGLDELPQLINIFMGDMSFFGPRPLSISDYQKMPFGRSRRTCVRPGLTGLAQVLGGQALEAPQKLNLDIWYIQNKTLCVHLNILCLSILRTIGLYNSLRAAEYGQATLLLKASEFRKLPVRQLVRL